MTNTQPKPKLTLANNIPVTIALQYSTGKRVSSRIPGAQDQTYYTLADGRGIYLPLEVGTMVDKLNLKPGELFSICKNGPRDWSISRVKPEPPQGPVNGHGEDCADVLARCYLAAVDIALMAVETARERGLMVSPSFEDLRAISATLLISETQGARR